MESQKSLRIYAYRDGVNDIPLYSKEEYEIFATRNGETFVAKDGSVWNIVTINNNIDIAKFTYNAKRMGAAPTITLTLMYPDCLDGLWTDEVYVIFNGTRYFISKTPSSSYSNADCRYKHDMEFVDERVILDNTYFFDAVADGTMQEDDKPVSNGTKFSFFGDIHDFCRRLNMSLRYSRLQSESNGVISGYRAIVDSDVTSEEKFVSFEDEVFSNAIQQSYNTFEVPYYYVGKEIHFGYSPNSIDEVFEYGVDNALISINRQNADAKVINKIAAKGSSDNLPYYYPNTSPKGYLIAQLAPSSQTFKVEVEDNDKFSNAMSINEVLDYRTQIAEISGVYKDKPFNNNNKYINGSRMNKIYYGSSTPIADVYYMQIASAADGVLKLRVNPIGTFTLDAGGQYQAGQNSIETTISFYMNDKFLFDKRSIETNNEFEIPVTASESTNPNILKIRVVFSVPREHSYDAVTSVTGLQYEVLNVSGWYYHNKMINLKDFGLKATFANTTPRDASTITQLMGEYIQPVDHLELPIYRESKGKERFLPAVDNTYFIDERTGTEKYVFPNPFVEGHPKEHIVTFDDIKPTIKECRNRFGERIDKFVEFAYDEGDNNETFIDDEGNTKFVHPYFFAKLRRLDFNLFDHANENGEMTISFTSGNCGACSFKIGVSEEEPQRNTVQVDSNGNLLRDETGRVLCGEENFQKAGVSPQSRQNDTYNNEVWIALMKEEETFGILMPKAPTYDGTVLLSSGIRPKAVKEGTTISEEDADTFVILNINLPEAYILDAEKRLQEAAIKYMYDNNIEKFNFSITFSRIYFEEHPDVLALIDENARFTIRYNEEDVLLYVSSITYSMGENDILPDIKVDLTDTLTTSSNAIKEAIGQVKESIGVSIGAIDFAARGERFFLRKDQDGEEVQGLTKFTKGIVFGQSGEIRVTPDNETQLSIDYLNVKKKATFSDIVVDRKNFTGGQVVVSSGSLVVKEATLMNGDGSSRFYRCSFTIENGSGNEVFNSFAINDLAICQTYNTYETHFYWRKVVGVGLDYVDLSDLDGEKAIGSDEPRANDVVVQLGNTEDASRQNAIVISSYGDDAPFIIQYKGINTFNIPTEGDNIVTKFSASGNTITGTVNIKEGSTGASNFSDLPQFIQDNISNLEFGKYNLLRNSGFTGDYISRSLGGGVSLTEGSDMFSPPLDHWEATAGTTVSSSVEATSGYQVNFVNNDSISQSIEEKVVIGNKYMLSFKIRGIGRLTYAFAGISGGYEDAVEQEWRKVVIPIIAETASQLFLLSGHEVSLCDIQLERGEVASSWGQSMMDNQSEMAMYQTLQYLKGAITEGQTTVSGGLILSNVLMLGNINGNDNTSGVSGIYNDNNDVAFWAGGTLENAAYLAVKYAENPSYDPSREDPDKMVNYIVTHGGNVMLNDAIFRGNIYSENGSIGGFNLGENWLKAEGKTSVTDYTTGTPVTSQGVYSNYQSAASVIFSSDRDWVLNNSERYYTSEFSLTNIHNTIAPFEHTIQRTLVSYNSRKSSFIPNERVHLTGGQFDVSLNCSNPTESEASIASALRVKASGSSNGNNNIALNIEGGVVRGLNLPYLYVEGGVVLNNNNHIVHINRNASVGLTLRLPSNPPFGKELVIIKQGGHTLRIESANGENIDFIGNNEATWHSISSSFRGRLTLLFTGAKWIMTN